MSKQESAEKTPKAGKGTAAPATAAQASDNFGIDRLSGGEPAPKGGYGVSYSLGPDGLPNFQTWLGGILDSVQVNEQVSLREYIALTEAKDTKRLAEIHSASESAPSEEGRYRELYLSAGSRPIHQFWANGSNYSGPGVEELWEVLHDKGIAHQSSPPPNPYMDERELELKLKLELELEPEPEPDQEPGG